MNWHDAVNGSFELAGGFAVLFVCFDIWKKRMVAGATAPVTVFFFAWGVWNVVYYPHLGQWASCAGGVFVVAVNILLLWLILRFGKHRATKFNVAPTNSRLDAIANITADVKASIERNIEAICESSSSPFQAGASLWQALSSAAMSSGALWSANSEATLREHLRTQEIFLAEAHDTMSGINPSMIDDPAVGSTIDGSTRQDKDG